MINDNEVLIEDCSTTRANEEVENQGEEEEQQQHYLSSTANAVDDDVLISDEKPRSGTENTGDEFQPSMVGHTEAIFLQDMLIGTFVSAS